MLIGREDWGTQGATGTPLLTVWPPAKSACLPYKNGFVIFSARKVPENQFPEQGQAKKPYKFPGASRAEGPNLYSNVEMNWGSPTGPEGPHMT